ncbi:MAG: efflux RND transporter permease subunit [Bacteroidales bacterium]|nr:efflux RND transporter permease subunit [Bacteroidales bacterium]
MKKRTGITETVMANPKIIFLIVGLLVILGIYGLDKMNKQEFPEFVIRQGIVAAVYPGASSEEVEQQVTTPLEEYLFTFQEVNKKRTYSYSKEGIVYIYVELDYSVMNQTEVWSKIRHGLKDFKSQLPAGVLALVVVDDFGNTSSLLVSLDSRDKTYREMDSYMDMLKKRLRSVPAVGNIKSFGDQHEVLDVYLDKEKLASYGISYQAVTAQLFSQGLLSIGGTLTGDSEEVPLHVSSPYQSERELGEQVIYTSPWGHAVRLQDVARIERCYATPSSYITQNGNQALVLSIEMRPGNNIVKFGEDVDVVLQDFRRILPDGVSLTRITDLPKVVDDSIWSFLKDLLTAILVVIAVMLMLFPITSALIPAIEIPLTTAITISVMYIIGYEMNTVTLAALIVTLGMIVDDSIVMIDGYMDNLRHGERPWHAAVHSAKTFFPSLIVATVSICAIFFPFLFTMVGPLADFVKFFPTTISISLGISLALAMLLTPWLEQRMISPDRRHRENVLTRTQNRFFNGLETGYEKLLRFCFRHPWPTIGAGFLSVGLAVLLFFHLPLQLMPKAERDSFAVEIHLPAGTSLQQTAKVCQDFEQVLSQDKDIVGVTTFVGSSSPRFMAAYSPNMPAKNYAQMIVRTKDYDVTEQVIKRYKDTYVDAYPNAVIRVKQLDYQGVKNPVEVHLYGEDQALLRQYADTLKCFMQSHDDLVWVHNDMDGSLPTVRIDLKPEEASRLGVTKAVLSANLATLFDGLPVTTVWEKDYPLQVTLKIDRASTPQTVHDSVTSYIGSDFDMLQNTLVPTAVPGVWVPLRQVAYISPDWQPAQIVHRNGIPCATVGADLRFGRSQPTVMKKLRPWLEGEFSDMLPEGISMSYGGLDAVNQDNMNGIIIGLIAAITIVFFFLLFNFKKIRLTLLSLCGTGLCLLGGFVGLWIFGADVSLTAIIGIVSLIGINVRNTIVMFDYAEELRAENRPIKEVAFEAGCRRMRPIFLTSATTAVGVIPMIIHRSTLWMPMGIVICFGTICAIALIVTVLPVAYWKLFDHSKVKN